MMGEPVGRRGRFFYQFNLEEMVPSDHLLRNIDAVLELSWLRSELAPYDSHTGCPSVDPELLIRMLIVGDCRSIRSERRLCQELKVNLAYRWFCGLGLEDRVPDHSTFSVNRHGRFRASDILRKVFEEVVCGRMPAGLVGAEQKNAAQVRGRIVDMLQAGFLQVCTKQTDVPKFSRGQHTGARVCTH